MPEKLTAQQSKAIADCMTHTGLDNKVAAKLLKQHTWNVTAAINAHYDKAPASQIFDEYRDPNEPDAINAEGSMALLTAMTPGLGHDLTEIDAIIFSEWVQSPTSGRIERKEFINACVGAKVENVTQMAKFILARRKSIEAEVEKSDTKKKNREQFQQLYIHTFKMGLSETRKVLTAEEATDFWQVLFRKPLFDWRTQATPWCDWWLEFLHQNKVVVNKDLWRQTLKFAFESTDDDKLNFWNEESSWPSVIDDFVRWVKKEKRSEGRQGEDAMVTD